MKRALLLLGLILALPAPSSAHPETGFLPDAIAETEYSIVLDINPKDTQTRNRLAMVYLRKNRLKEAERELALVLKIAPRDFDAHDGMGSVRYKQNNYADAVSWLRRAVALNAEDTMVHHSLGLALERLGKLTEARACYRQALAVNERQMRKPALRDRELQKKQAILASLQALQQRLSSKGGQ